MTKFLIVGDLHGPIPEIYVKDFDAVIAPGDFCDNNEYRKHAFGAMRKNMADPSLDIDWWDEAGGKCKAKKMIKESRASGRKALEFLNSLNVPVYLVPGNGDLSPMKDSSFRFERKDHWEKMIKGLTNIIDCHNKLIITSELNFIGYGLNSGPELPVKKNEISNLTKEEFKGKRDKYQEKKKTLKKLFQLAKKNKKPTIYISHNVPHMTKIDKINNPASPKNGEHYGSLITKELIKEQQPLVTVSGHMHEHFDKVKIGKTTAINAGYGPKKNVLLEIVNGKIKQLKFIDKAK
jgi:Icc-related predicted phosphoesterase